MGVLTAQERCMPSPESLPSLLEVTTRSASFCLHQSLRPRAFSVQFTVLCSVAALGEDCNDLQSHLEHPCTRLYCCVLGCGCMRFVTGTQACDLVKSPVGMHTWQKMQRCSTRASYSDMNKHLNGEENLAAPQRICDLRCTYTSNTTRSAEIS